MLEKIHWPTASALIAALVCIAGAYLLGPTMGIPDAYQDALVAGVGSVFAIVLSALRALLSHDGDRDGMPDIFQKRPPSGGSGGASGGPSMRVAMLLILALTFASMNVGCGANALHTNATIARAMLSVQSTTGPLIREARVADAIAAGLAVRGSGGSEEAAQAAAMERADRWECALDGHRVYSLTVGAYVDALMLWEASGDVAWLDVVPFIESATDAYRVLAACLDSLGSTALPAEPEFILLLPVLPTPGVPHVEGRS